MLRNIEYPQCKKIVVTSFLYFAVDYNNRKVAGLLLELEVVAVCYGKFQRLLV